MAVNGTVNDLAMSGARPLWLTAAFIIEEGLPIAELAKIAGCMARAARAAGITRDRGVELEPVAHAHHRHAMVGERAADEHDVAGPHPLGPEGHSRRHEPDAGDEAMRRGILALARRRLGAAVAPKELAFLPALPRTRSGKIMRRLLKARELGLPEGDLSTLENPDGAAANALGTTP